MDRGGGRGPAARLGLAVRLCTLPWLGFVPDDIWAVPRAAGGPEPAHRDGPDADDSEGGGRGPGAMFGGQEVR
ncbi:hypothetical protein ACIBKY_38720 [Nonomuraea sp. NPDC050394]|uniref:hypothetical protein n=1 Tax=Nonomuraea sp. NPDC050394 TaxID=3364363 RepID=UPI003794361F